MPLISIVVPAFNPDEHFVDCLRSIAAQTFHDYEVLIVDDGSNMPVDPAILVENGICGTSSKVIRTDNSGPYAARRKGIEEACGTYIMNIDADDELIGSDALGKIAAALDFTRADMLLINASFLRDGSTPILDYSALGAVSRAREAALVDPKAFRTLFASDYIYNSTWTKLVRRECVDGSPAPYPRVVMAEDRMLDMDFLPNIRSCALLNKPLYFYRPSETSITHSGYRAEFYLQVCGVESRVLEWLDSVGFEEGAWAENFLRMTCNALLALSYNDAISDCALEEAFDLVAAQDVYIRADKPHYLRRLGLYARGTLLLLGKKKYKTLRALLHLRGLLAAARSAARNVKLTGGR